MSTRRLLQLFVLALALCLPGLQADATSMSRLRLEWDYNGTTKAWIGPDDPEILVMNVVIRTTEPEVLSAYTTILYDTDFGDELDFAGSSDNITQISESDASEVGRLELWDAPGTISGGAITIGTIAFRTNLDTVAFDGRDLFVGDTLLIGEEGPLSMVMRGSAELNPRDGVPPEMPEPSTAALMLGGVGLMLWGARGRRDAPAPPS